MLVGELLAAGRRCPARDRWLALVSLSTLSKGESAAGSCPRRGSNCTLNPPPSDGKPRRLGRADRLVRDKEPAGAGEAAPDRRAAERQHVDDDDGRPDGADGFYRARVVLQGDPRTPTPSCSRATDATEEASAISSGSYSSSCSPRCPSYSGAGGRSPSSPSRSPRRSPPPTSTTPSSSPVRSWRSTAWRRTSGGRAPCTRARARPPCSCSTCSRTTRSGSGSCSGSTRCSAPRGCWATTCAPGASVRGGSRPSTRPTCGGRRPRSRRGWRASCTTSSATA